MINKLKAILKGWGFSDKNAARLAKKPEKEVLPSNRILFKQLPDNKYYFSVKTKKKKAVVKTKLETTLKLLMKHNACQSGFDTLKASLKPNIKETDKINLLHILKSNGLNHFFWAWRATTKKEMQVKRYILADIVESVEPLFAKKYPEDLSVKNVIKYLRKGTAKQLREAGKDADNNTSGAFFIYSGAYHAAKTAFYAANFRLFKNSYSNCCSASASANNSFFFNRYGLVSTTNLGNAPETEGLQKQIKIIKKYLK